MIDEKKLIEALHKWDMQYLYLPVQFEWLLYEQTRVNQWIPCRERTPEEYVPVNVTWKNNNPESYYSTIKGIPFTATAVYYKNQWYWYSATCVDYLKEYGNNDIDLIDKDIEVIAWMPLPEPYKG